MALIWHCVADLRFADNSGRGGPFGGHQLDGVAVGCEQASPVMGTRAGFDADDARGQCAHPFVELGACDFGLAQLHGTCGIHTVQSKDVLGEIDSNEDNGHDFPFRMS